MLDPGKKPMRGQPGGGRRQRERRGVVRASRVDGDARIVVEDGLRRRAQVLLGNVHRHVGRRAACVQQQAHLGAAAAAVFHQTAPSRHAAGDGRAVGAQNRDLRARQVVLGQPRDGVEQPRTRGVVEVLGGNGLARLAQSMQDLRSHVRPRRAAIEHLEPSGAVGAGRRRGAARFGAEHVVYRASRMPVNCQRSLG